jgi:8-oxo-dGTP pyrophosphatase MutT (NUDIX family)
MYVTAAVLAAAEAALGTPRELYMRYRISPEESRMVRASQKHGRAHDVTTIIQAGDELAIIAKHSYPPGLFRIPGGGLEPGEALVAGGIREALEETGLPYTPRHYLLRVFATFETEDTPIAWTTHVVWGTASRVPMQPRDLKEIREARWGSWPELVGPIAQALLATGRPLFAYRVALHQEAWHAHRALQHCSDSL